MRGNFSQRIAALEEQIGVLRPDRLQPVPMDWAERDDSGRMIGPPPGTRMPPGLAEAWSDMLAMDASIGGAGRNGR